MDWASIGGLALAIFGIIIGQTIDGGRFSSLIQPAAFVIVVFGTFGAVLLQSKFNVFVLGLRKLHQVFVIPYDDRFDIAERIALWSTMARREGILKLEPFIEDESDPFIRRCMRLVIEGVSPHTMKEICESDLYQYEQAERSIIKVWDSAGGYAPTIGILAAVMGLIHVMENLSDPSMLGTGIAVSFVATIYGVGLANLVFIPIANKLKAILQTRLAKYEMLAEGLIAICQGEHTVVIEDRLNGYLT